MFDKLMRILKSHYIFGHRVRLGKGDCLCPESMEHRRKNIMSLQPDNLQRTNQQLQLFTYMYKHFYIKCNKML